MYENNFEIKKEAYKNYLVRKELNCKTISKYLKDVERFYLFLEDRTVDFNAVSEYKMYLTGTYKSSTVNSYLISLNCYWRWMNMDDLCVSLIKRQRTYFSSAELTLNDYRKMIEFAEENNETKWYLVMRCLGAMGIRVGELKFITYEAVLSGYAEILFKAKLRTILIPEKLQRRLLSYCENENIHSGAVFLNKHKTMPLDSSVIWRNLKRIAEESGADKSAVYPHNFRHMFARAYMNTYHNIVELADILGHSSIETTRIYTKASKETQRGRLDSLGL